MKRLSFMLVAGEASGDMLAAELVAALREEIANPGQRAQAPATEDTLFAPGFFGAGGPRMAAAGVEVLIQMTDHAVIGISGVIRKLAHFHRMLRQLAAVAEQRQPDVIVCVDFSGFNRRFAHAVRRRLQSRSGVFSNWNPRIVQYVSPQVWASREGRVQQVARDYDLLLSIFPFEKAWYAQRVPQFPVEFVGHPMIDRHRQPARAPRPQAAKAEVVLLPGSRPCEIKRHLPVLLAAANQIRAAHPAQFTMVLPNDSLVSLAKDAATSVPDLTVQVGQIETSLRRADLALTKSGTISLECAFFGVPAVVFYITSWPNYWIGRRIVTVKYLAMPNLLADEALFPEFIQAQATTDNISRAALSLLRDKKLAGRTREKLSSIVSSLGPAGGSRRAAQAILKLL